MPIAIKGEDGRLWAPNNNAPMTVQINIAPGEAFSFTRDELARYFARVSSTGRWLVSIDVVLHLPDQRDVAGTLGALLFFEGLSGSVEAVGEGLWRLTASGYAKPGNVL
jgi:hypothetical protein